ncbi:hypothetical protein PHIN3_16 [Sinorhizobium phage phiN3]|uniref:Uncharacterized protein n=1 Tax=Sinorhizobium phage phiN3 TaxID=1647405 RepID=A0A0F6SIY9_9CAUD|nr:hypothetical protein AVT40_gp016 [Sinorhizobium phage phiN3]AKF13283.1 hypothetical protein PHIN3_16 [Sinorhizobium phage phiN3]
MILNFGMAVQSAFHFCWAELNNAETLSKIKNVIEYECFKGSFPEKIKSIESITNNHFRLTVEVDDRVNYYDVTFTNTNVSFEDGE